ncbi:hypothetical protein GCM10010412_038580 [Nonomuraea recticatena]|uniref:Uncharacterized protein n=1 Tax=Nonomuraea recticatena TaxID=46178 RepID=A0ABP6EG29_9ACTN
MLPSRMISREFVSPQLRLTRSTRTAELTLRRSLPSLFLLDPSSDQFRVSTGLQRRAMLGEQRCVLLPRQFASPAYQWKALTRAAAGIAQVCRCPAIRSNGPAIR